MGRYLEMIPERLDLRFVTTLYSSTVPSNAEARLPERVLQKELVGFYTENSFNLKVD